MKRKLSLFYRALILTKKLCPGYMAWGFSAKIFSSLYPFLNIYLSSLLIDGLIDKDWHQLAFLALITVCVNVICIIISSALNRQTDIRDKLLYQICKQVPGEHMMELDYESLQSAKTHERIRMLDDMHEITGMRLSSVIRYILLVTGRLIKIISAGIILFGSVLWYEINYITLIFVFVITAMIVLNVIIIDNSGKKRFKYYEEMLPSKKYKWYYDREYLDTYKTGREIRIFRQHKIIERDYNKSQSDYVKISRKLGIVEGRANGMSAVCSIIAQGAIYVYIGSMALSGVMGIGSIVRYVGYVRELYSGVNGLLTDLVGLRQVSRWLEAFFDFYDTDNTMYQGTLPVEKRAFCDGGDKDYEVEFRNVSFKYPGTDKFVLKKINFKFKIGERLAVVGMNGSGKTTFIKLLCRLYDPTDGEILLNGVDIRKYDYAEYMSIFAVVFQDFKLFSFSLGQNVAASVDYDKANAERCLCESGFGERLNTMPNGLDTCLYKNFDKNGVEISGGEAQKIALARALYKDAPFIILDEPTAALDPIAEAEVYSNFNNIVGDKTAVYISHRLSSCRFCNDIAVFNNGEIVQRGSHDELVSDESGKYYELWHAQAQYYTA